MVQQFSFVIINNDAQDIKKNEKKQRAGYSVEKKGTMSSLIPNLARVEHVFVDVHQRMHIIRHVSA